MNQNNKLSTSPVNEENKYDTWLMDGSIHERGGDCCGPFARTCKKCNGIAHYQPVYGGYYYLCEDCGDDSI